MRILIVTPEFPPDQGGGIITYYRDLAIALVALGCEVRILKGSAFEHGGDPYQFEGIQVSVLETWRYKNWLNRFSHFEMFPDLRRHLAAGFAMHEQAAAEGTYDAVEVTDWGLLFVPWVTSCVRNVLVQLHGSCGQISQREPVAGREAEGAIIMLLEQAVLRNASSVSSYSRANVNWWEGVLRGPVHYTPPPLGNESRATAGTRSSWVTFGRIQYWKGPHVACAAWQLLGDDAPVLEWYGRDTKHGATGLQTSAWLSGKYPETWGKKIIHQPQIEPNQVLQILSRAKAVVIPSDWDVFNFVAAEAMANGCVVIVSKGAGAADLVKHGINGFLFDAGDKVALAALVRVVEAMSIAECCDMGAAAMATVANLLAPEKVASDKLDLYRSCPPLASQSMTWFQEALLPEITRTTATFMDALPLRKLCGHVLRRIVEKASFWRR